MYPKRISRRRSVFVIIGLSAGVLTAAAIWKESQWRHLEVSLDDNLSLRVSLRCSHPVLAEYERKLTIVKNGKRTASLRYHQDTGGGLPLRVRYFSDSASHLVRLTDSLFDQLVDLDHGTIVNDADQGDGIFKIVEVSEANLPPALREVVIGRDLSVKSDTKLN